MSIQRTCTRILTGLFVMAALSACDRSVDLRLNVEPGDKRVFQVTRVFKFTGPDMMSSSGSEESTSRATYAYEVTGTDDAGKTEVKVTASLAALAVNDTLAPIVQAIMDEGVPMLGDEAFPTGDNPFANLDDVELSLDIDPDGTLTSVTGMDEIGEKLAATLLELSKAQLGAGQEQMGAGQGQMQQMLAMMGPGGAGFMRQMETVAEKVTWQIRRIMSDQAATSNLRFLTDVLPADTVQTGSTWKRSSNVFFPPAFVFETFTVTGRSGRVCTLKYEADITPRSDNSIDLGLVRLAFNVEGTKTGTIQVDEQTGWINAATIEVKQNTNVSVKLDLSSLGMGDMSAIPGVGDMDDIPLGMEGTIHVESGTD